MATWCIRVNCVVVYELCVVVCELCVGCERKEMQGKGNKKEQV